MGWSVLDKKLKAPTEAQVAKTRAGKFKLGLF